MYRSCGNGVRGSIPSSSGLVTNMERPQSPDVDLALGAYLVAHLQQRCENCLTSETPQWRKGWYSVLLQRSVVLCNACGLKFNKNQFCPYCMFVYYKEEERKYQHNNWVTCKTCQRWVHLVCENQYGDGTFHFNIPKEENISFGNSPTSSGLCVSPSVINKSYQCPTCRVSSNSSNTSSNAENEENHTTSMELEKNLHFAEHGTSPGNQSSCLTTIFDRRGDHHLQFADLSSDMH